MNNENKPLQDQYPGDDSAPEELLVWAKKAKARIIRDIHEKSSLKYKNKKLQKQLVGQQIHSAKIRSKITIYENVFSLGLWSVIKFWANEKHKKA